MKHGVAMVTGGRRGIGLAIAKALADAGFDIAIADLAPEDDAAISDVLASLRGVGSNAAYYQCDISDLPRHATLVSRIEQDIGAITCLVNNAGMGSVIRGDFLDLSAENFDLLMGVNVRGTLFLTQAVVRSMLQRPANLPRSIINITSISAVASSPERMDYCISKSAISSFAQALALRLAPSDIQVFEIRPGIIRTEMTAKVADKYDKAIADSLVPARRWGEPGDVATIAASLATGGFGFATGSIVHADGGLHISRL